MRVRLITVCGLAIATVLGVSLLLMVSISPIPSQAQTQNAQGQQAAVQNDSTCLNCHDIPSITSIYGTAHGNASVPGSPSAAGGCSTCHGDSSNHSRAIQQAPGVVFGEGSSLFSTSTTELQNQTCLNCHESRETVHWTASPHQAADLTCVSCHTIHASQSAALDELRDASICLNCHLEQRSQLNRRSHHPVAEGLMTCNDCHNPHGSDAVALLSRSSINETCTSCHAEMRGPFLWEHQPVDEDCTTCHNSHGSTQNALLSMRQPFLCQTCHSEAFHPSSLYSGTGLPPAGAQQNLLGSSCTSCHSTVHGSNHPSGSRLTR